MMRAISMRGGEPWLKKWFLAKEEVGKLIGAGTTSFSKRSNCYFRINNLFCSSLELIINIFKMLDTFMQPSYVSKTMLEN